MCPTPIGPGQWDVYHVRGETTRGGNVTARKVVDEDDVLLRGVTVGRQLELLEDRIRLKRRSPMGLVLHGLKDSKEILISQITSVQYKKAGLMFNGYIQFAFMGGTESRGGVFLVCPSA